MPLLRLLGAAVVLASLLMPGALAAAREFDIEVGTRSDGSMYVEPSSITSILGDDVTFRVKNVDRIFHDIALLDYDGNDIEIEVPAGRTESHSLKATVPGDFRMICEVSGHKQKGMFGFFHVVDPDAKKGLPDIGVVGTLLVAGIALALVYRRK